MGVGLPQDLFGGGIGDAGDGLVKRKEGEADVLVAEHHVRPVDFGEEEDDGLADQAPLGEAEVVHDLVAETGDDARGGEAGFFL